MHLIRSFSETLFQVGFQLSHDPASTLNKISKKLSYIFPGSYSNFKTSGKGTKTQSEARRLYDTGKLTAVSNAEAPTAWSKVEKYALTKSANYQLEFLRARIMASPERKVKLSVERPLYVLTSSLPFTQSGYTIRSHYLSKAMLKAGLGIEAVTRAGYPSSIGTLARSKNEVIDGVRYNLNSHWHVPMSTEKQIQMAVAGLVQVAIEHKSTILYTTTDFRNAIVTSRAALELGIPWVYEIRGELEKTWLSRVPSESADEARMSEYYLLSEEQEKSAREAASKIFVISKQIENRLLQENIPKSKIHLLPNAIDELDFGRSKSAEVLESVTGLAKASAVIGTVSAIVEYEGLDTLIEALEFLPLDFHILIVGDGTHRPALEVLVEKLGYQERVHFVGKKPMDTIQDWYQLLDVFVVPRNDSELCRSVTPIKAMQAQSLGIPVAASDLPALREVTGGFAEYAAPEDPEALATAVQNALEQSRKSEGDVSELRQWLESRTWDANAERIIRAFREI